MRNNNTRQYLGLGNQQWIRSTEKNIGIFSGIILEYIINDFNKNLLCLY